MPVRPSLGRAGRRDQVTTAGGQASSELRRARGCFLRPRKLRLRKQPSRPSARAELRATPNRVGVAPVGRARRTARESI